MSLSSQATQQTAAVVDFSTAAFKRGARFTKAEIADIARDAKVKVQAKPKTDRIIVQIKRADTIMDRFIEASSELFEAKQRLDKHDRGCVSVHPIDEPEIFHEFGHGFVFCSEHHVSQQFLLHRRTARQRLAQTREQVAKAKRNGSQVSLELLQRIDAEKRKIAALMKFEGEQKRAVRKETVRLYKMQKSAGFLEARERHRQARRALHKMTKTIAIMKPTTSEGALAVVDYVRRRLFPDRREYFFESRGTDGQFWQLLQCAHQVLATHSSKVAKQ